MPVNNMLIAYLFLLGLITGSFLNLVIDRWPGSCIHPPSHCTACGHELRWHEMIPVLSWLALRGRCRACGARLGWKHPLMELLTGTVFAILAWRLGSTTSLYALLPLASLLIVISGIDARLLIIPNRLVFPGIAFAIPVSIFILGNNPWDVLGGAAYGFLFFFLTDLFITRKLKKPGLSMGDAKLVALLSALTGFLHFPAFMITASLLPLLFWPLLKKHSGWLPFAPWLSLGWLLSTTFELPCL